MYCELAGDAALEVVVPFIGPRELVLVPALLVVVGALELDVVDCELVVMEELNEVLEEDVVLDSELDEVRSDEVEGVMLEVVLVDVEVVANELCDEVEKRLVYGFVLEELAEKLLEEELTYGFELEDVAEEDVFKLLDELIVMLLAEEVVEEVEQTPPGTFKT